MHGVGRSGEPVFGAIVKPASRTVVQSDFVVPIAHLWVTASKNEISKADFLDDYRQGFPEAGE